MRFGLSDRLFAVIFAILLLFVACAPALNPITGDQAELLYVINTQEGPCAPAVSTGLCFVPRARMST